MSEENSGTSTLLAFLLGAAAGVAAGLLLAPRSGRDTRKRLGRWIEDMEDGGKDVFKEGQKLWEQGKGAVQEKAEKIKKDIESIGKEIGEKFSRPS